MWLLWTETKHREKKRRMKERNSGEKKRDFRRIPPQNSNGSLLCSMWLFCNGIISEVCVIYEASVFLFCQTNRDNDKKKKKHSQLKQVLKVMVLCVWQLFHMIQQFNPIKRTKKKHCIFLPWMRTSEQILSFQTRLTIKSAK